MKRKRTRHYIAAAFYALVALLWAWDAARLLWAGVQGRSVTLDRWDAMSFGVAAAFLAGMFVVMTLDYWLRARCRMTPVSTVELVLRVDRSKFDHELAKLRRSL